MSAFFVQNQIAVMAFFSSVVLSFVLTRLVLFVALRVGWTAKSNERSSHVGQLAFGGGLSVIGAALAGWMLFAPPISQLQKIVLFGTLILAIISWLDDLNNLPSSLRMLVHLIVVAICLWFLPSQENILPLELPLIVDRVLTAFFWLWFINLFNFMDGIDGLAAVETAFVGVGVFIVGTIGLLGLEWSILAISIVGAALGFLPWNWHRARIMLGDLGAVPLGFLLGFLLILLSLQGYWLAALILPGYFVVDATITIIRRLLKGEKIWRAHRTHFYQRACRPSEGHDRVVVRVIVANVFLVLSGVMSVFYPIVAVVFAIAVLCALLISLTKLAKAIR